MLYLMMRDASSPFSPGVPFQRMVCRMTGMMWWCALALLLKLLVKKCISRRMIVSIDVALTSVKLLVGPMVGGRGFVPVAYFIA